jgi:hypothetical protein
VAFVQFFSDLDMHALTFFIGTVTFHDATRLVVSDGKIVGATEAYYTGKFTYDSFGNVFGTLNSVTLITSGSVVYSATGLNVAAQLLQIDQIQRIIPTALGGDDTFSARPGTHTFDGYGGYNIVIEPSVYADYRIGNGSIPTVSGAGSQDMLYNIQGVQFFDGFYDTQVQRFFPIGSGFVASDMTTNRPSSDLANAYHGPVAGLQSEFISITPDKLNISASTPNWFIHSGSGDDAIAASHGINVLDGGTGSNFLTGGGTDTFFVDDRAAKADIWSTVVGFHGGDAATIWGVTPQDFGLNWVNGQGAAGFTGLTLHATAVGRPTASLTLTGYSTADLSNGRLAVSFGQVGGSNYMYVQGN